MQRQPAWKGDPYFDPYQSGKVLDDQDDELAIDKLLQPRLSTSQRPSDGNQDAGERHNISIERDVSPGPPVYVHCIYSRQASPAPDAQPPPGPNLRRASGRPTAAVQNAQIVSDRLGNAREMFEQHGVSSPAG